MENSLKIIFQDYDISVLFTPVNTSNNVILHHRDKQQKAVKVMLCVRFVASQNMLVKIYIYIYLDEHRYVYIYIHVSPIYT